MKAQMPAPETNPCNSRKENDCPLVGKRRTANVVYQATVKSNDIEETYVGLTENTFKLRLANHQQAFTKEKHRNQTELSKHVWILKNSNTDFKIHWKILAHVPSYSNVSQRCNLCMMEKFYIKLPSRDGVSKSKIRVCQHVPICVQIQTHKLYRRNLDNREQS
ncbi:hypothetical protein HOLleu_42097 [Holothuria leucospilota]|uniref:GIY-YIG domain-containing protein n=1 Tax=Holothuria leucospilota TaxID=206669 RepID=A0A9Q1BAB3_HOLLE|nr:hypothetical protein HOLleu_42097 [Holothuria leucospilota]